MKSFLNKPSRSEKSFEKQTLPEGKEKLPERMRNNSGATGSLTKYNKIAPTKELLTSRNQTFVNHHLCCCFVVPQKSVPVLQAQCTTILTCWLNIYQMKWNKLSETMLIHFPIFWFYQRRTQTCLQLSNHQRKMKQVPKLSPIQRNPLLMNARRR